jgi:cysteine synthase A
VAVDVVGSIAMGGPPRTRHLTGIGSARAPDFRVHDAYTDLAVVSEWESVTACRQLREQTGIGVGASTGAVVAAFLSTAAAATRSVTGVALIADGAENYESTIYNDGWTGLAMMSRQCGLPDVHFRVRGNRQTSR